jgi:hypothetical protein
MSKERTMIDDAVVRELVDREKIRDCLARYSTGVDRCDAEMLLSSYWPDARDEHGEFKGTAEEFVAWVIPQLKRFVYTQHFMGHSLIRFEGDRARVQTYTQNWHTVRNFAGHLQDVIHGGRYLDVFEKRGELVLPKLSSMDRIDGEKMLTIENRCPSSQASSIDAWPGPTAGIGTAARTARNP